MITDWVASQLLREQQLVKDLGNRRKEEKSTSKKQKQKNKIITASKQLFCHLGGMTQNTHFIYILYKDLPFEEELPSRRPSILKNVF